jgi:Mg2+/Co2+ transporter CorB
LHHVAGVVVKNDRDMLGSILDLEETEVGEIMIHRKQMETIDIGQKPADIIQQVLKSSFTRIPFWEGETDNIVGLMHAKDLLRVIQAQEGDVKTVDIYSMLTDPWFIPETTSLKVQLRSFMEKKNHFALVVDEYGDLQGMVTLEDILEEIVGQIEDEHDDTEHNTPQLIQEKDDTYIVDGIMTIRDFNRELDWDLPDEEAATVAGLVIHEAQNIPDKGQVFQFHGCRFEIISKQKNQITKIRINKLDDVAVEEKG